HRRGLLVVLVASLLGLGVGEPALGQHPMWRPASVRPQDAASEDLVLTLRALRALLADDALAPYPLGVSVRDRIASLWGSVPSPQLARRAEQRVRSVVGITAIRSRLQVGEASDGLPPLLPPLPQRAPFAEPYVPQPVKISGAVVRRPGEVGSGGEELLWRAP